MIYPQATDSQNKTYSIHFWEILMQQQPAFRQELAMTHVCQEPSTGTMFSEQ